MLIAVASVKGSPGVTTLALTLAAVWPPDGDPAVVVEADCAGGDVGGRCWLPDTPGLASLAAAARAGTVVIEDHVAVLPCGVRVVVGPAERQPATVGAGLLAEAGAERWSKERPTIVDVGRLEPGTPGATLAASAEALVVCTHGDEASLARLVTSRLPAQAALVVLGGSAYGLQEIQEAVGVSVVTHLPRDARAAQVVWGQAHPTSGWTRRGLPAVARVLAQQLATRNLVPPRQGRRGPKTGVEAWLRSPGRST